MSEAHPLATILGFCLKCCIIEGGKVVIKNKTKGRGNDSEKRTRNSINFKFIFIFKSCILEWNLPAVTSMMRKNMRWIRNPRSDVFLQRPRDQYEVNRVWVSLIHAIIKSLLKHSSNKSSKKRVQPSKLGSIC